MELILTLGLGLVLGFQHAADPDHLAAVATLVARTRRRGDAARLGVWWGLGHTATLLLVGLVILIFHLNIPPKLSLLFEFLVGLMLIVLGANLLRRLATDKLHAHEHAHDGATHTHFHSHEHTLSHTHHHLSFATGLLHGLAGSAALSLLTLATAPSLWHGLLFIALFGLGSILGMFMASAAISAPFALLHNQRHAPVVIALAGTLSIGSGIVLATTTMKSILG